MTCTTSTCGQKRHMLGEMKASVLRRRSEGVRRQSQPRNRVLKARSLPATATCSGLVPAEITITLQLAKPAS